jgi:AAA domain-containing protein/putative AbiEii toxin of type IV toxin-antitoxin system
MPNEPDCDIIRSTQVEYLMLQAFTIQNFRCFRSQSMRDLRQINLVVGPNGTGKTALLEALYLVVGGGTQIALNIRQFRGLAGEFNISSDGSAFRAFWSDLFYHFDEDKTISISCVDSKLGARELSITYKAGDQMVLPISGENGEKATRPFVSTPLNFVYKLAGKETQTVPIQLTENGLRLGAIRDAIPGVYMNPGHGYGVSAVGRFSELSKVNRDREVVSMLRKEYPQVESISVEVQAGTPVLYAFLPSIPEGKLPMELVSAGINKYLNILLAIASSPRGVVFVDEIENGFYYEQLPSICAGLLDFCEQFEVQLFASTHSIEFVKAWTLLEKDSKFCLLRSSKQNGSCELKRFSGTDLHSAVEQGVEFR